MTPRRWEVLRALVGREPLSMDALAGLIGRDADEVRTDVEALKKAGVVEPDHEDRISFPFDAVHVDFTLGRAA